MKNLLSWDKILFENKNVILGEGTH